MDPTQIAALEERIAQAVLREKATHLQRLSGVFDNQPIASLIEKMTPAQREDFKRRVEEQLRALGDS